VAIAVPTKHVERTARALRMGSPGVMGRVQEGTLWIDLRGVAPEEDAGLLAGLRRVVE
jgi:hypothetical protein